MPNFHSTVFSPIFTQPILDPVEPKYLRVTSFQNLFKTFGQKCDLFTVFSLNNSSESTGYEHDDVKKISKYKRPNHTQNNTECKRSETRALSGDSVCIEH
jgi:hypothetical protein